MLYVALVLSALLVVTVVAFTGLIRSLIRSNARERDLLLNQLLHASGKTWQPPPKLEPVVTSAWPAEPVERVIRFTESPEQFPAAV